MSRLENIREIVFGVTNNFYNNFFDYNFLYRVSIMIFLVFKKEQIKFIKKYMNDVLLFSIKLYSKAKFK